MGLVPGEPQGLVWASRRVLVQRITPRAPKQDHPPIRVASDLVEVAVEPVRVVAAVVTAEVPIRLPRHGYILPERGVTVHSRPPVPLGTSLPTFGIVEARVSA